MSLCRSLSAFRTPGNQLTFYHGGRCFQPGGQGCGAILGSLRYASLATLPQLEICRMNVVQGLQAIRDRLVENDADAATISTVDIFLKRASLPAAQSAAAQSQLQLVRMLMRTPASNANVRIYNDLARLEEELESAAVTAQAARAAEEAKPVPKTKKFYKQQKEREEKKA